MAIQTITFNPLDGSTGIVNAATADSKAVVADDEASVADSKAVSAGTIADSAGTKADSAVGSEPGIGEFKVTDIDRNAAGSIVISYDDSAIS